MGGGLPKLEGALKDRYQARLGPETAQAAAL